ncbi:M67 family metallopeptidase [Paenibacillus glufosinatiresistens]|uniref:M67 family metallopeptidase n=1 Tax=Paenibacillus glufosinatiresistens TaxID=3070657 RepID=UPI00286EABDE|nr:M67 family metallopeptidase [Paenibacillus sp. YX.27]
MTAFQGGISAIRLKPAVQQELGKHLLTSLPHEACGVLLGAAAAGGMRIDGYMPMRNVAPDPLHSFVPHPADWVRAVCRTPSPVGLFHSHPASPPVPSSADLRGLAGWQSLFAVCLIGSPPAQQGELPVWRGYRLSSRDRDGSIPSGMGAELELVPLELVPIPVHVLLR